MPVMTWRLAAGVLAAFALGAATLTEGRAQSAGDPSVFVDPTDLLTEPAAAPEVERGFDMPPPPPLPRPAQTAPPASARPDSNALVRSAPPAAGQCVTNEEFSRALAAGGCDCSCGEYARLDTKGPAQARICSVACGMSYHKCWAPPPTERDIDAAAAEMGPAGPLMLAESGGRDTVRGLLVMQRAMAWHDARMCSADR